MKKARESWPVFGLALGWGLAEATLFFIVPDVLLTWVALDSRKRALQCCGAAVAGALIGGIVMFQWGGLNAESAYRTLDAVPAISPAMIESVQERITEQGPPALFIGPLTGTPYKVYAVAAGNTGQTLWLFLLISIPARLLRFVILTLFAAGVSRMLSARLDIRRRHLLLLSIWAMFYVGYFWLMPN